MTSLLPTKLGHNLTGPIRFHNDHFSKLKIIAQSLTNFLWELFCHRLFRSLSIELTFRLKAHFGRSQFYLSSSSNFCAIIISRTTYHCKNEVHFHLITRILRRIRSGCCILKGEAEVQELQEQP